MSLKARAALIIAAVCLALAGGILTWQPWAGAFSGLCGATSGLRAVQPGTVVAFWLPLDDRDLRVGDTITLRSADLKLESGTGRFVGVRVRPQRPGLEWAMTRWPDPESDLSEQTTKPLAGYRLRRGEVTSVYFLVEQTGPGTVRWKNPSITYHQGWRIYTASSADCHFETDSRPI
ncbi:hypothetical protein [Flindersiella endophytica]